MLAKESLMKTKIATLVLLTVTAGSASAHGGEVVTGLVVGAVVGNMIASQSRAAVTVHYGGYAPPLVVHAPPPVVGYAPLPPVLGYAPPPVMVYPPARVYYGDPAFGPGHGYGYRHHQRHQRQFEHRGWGQPRW
jgi:hypothetical protein